MAHPKKPRSVPHEPRPGRYTHRWGRGRDAGLGVAVLAEAWYGEPLRPLGACVRPVSGDPHDCALALIQYAARWGTIVRLYKCAGVVYTVPASR
jgi:hypothetical protein